MRQSTAFLRKEADRYYTRNMHKPRPNPDPVMQAIKSLNIKPKGVLEIGCGNGWRLLNIRKELGSLCYGIDPSKKAIMDAPQDIPKHGVKCWRGTADDLKGIADHSMGMVIYGFCLYLADRDDLFKIAYEADRVLRDGGHIIIHDFFPPYSYARLYEHADGLLSFKQDYSKLWTGNPAYRIILERVIRNSGPDSREAVIVIHKDPSRAWPLVGDFPQEQENEISLQDMRKAV